jgi:hypothetical protein
VPSGLVLSRGSRGSCVRVGLVVVGHVGPVVPVRQWSSGSCRPRWSSGSSGSSDQIQFLLVLHFFDYKMRFITAARFVYVVP